MAVNRDLFNGEQFETPKFCEKDRDFDKEILKDRFVKDTYHRENLIVFTKYIVKFWLVSVVIFLFLSGSGILRFKLSDSVLCVLLGTTTINVVGLAYIILKGLFRNNYTVDTKEDKHDEI